MTAAYQAAGAGLLTATSGAACTPTNPTGIVAGDLLLAHVFFGGSTTAPDTPSDWSLLDGPRDLSTPGTNGRVWVYGKKAVGSDANPAFGTQAVTTPRRARVYRFDGVLDTVVASMVGGFQYATGTSASITDTAVNAGADASDYLAVNLVAISENPTIGPFTGETGGDWTEAVAEFTGTTGTPDTCMQIQTAVIAPSTTINGGAVTPSTTNPWGVVGFYIRSEPPPPGPTVTATESVYNTATTPKSVVVAGCLTDDYLLMVAGGNDNADVTAIATSTTGGSTGSWTDPVEEAFGANSPWISSALARVTADGSVTVQVAATGAVEIWGMCVFRVRGSSGLGVHGKVATSATEVVNLAGISQDSAVFYLSADWSAAAVGTGWTPIDGILVERAVEGSGEWTNHIAYWLGEDAGTRDYGSTGAAGTSIRPLAIEMLAEAGGGQTVNIGQVTETESARPVTLLKTETAGQAIETESSRPVTLLKTETAGQVIETETARAVTTRKTVVLGQVVEIELAQPVSLGGGAQTIPIGQVVETESARPVTLLKTETAGQVTETESARSVTLRGAKPIGQVTETESSRPVTLLKTETAGQVTETETSRPVVTRKTVVLGQVIETELAQSVSLGGAQNVPIGRVTETESARPVTLRRTKLIGQIAEIESVWPVTTRRVVAIGQVVEPESVLALTVVGGAPVFTVGAARASVSLVATGKSTAGVGGKASVSPAASGAHSEDGG